MNRNAKKLSRALLVATLVVIVSARSRSGPEAQTPQFSIADKPPAAATSATGPSSAKPTLACSPSTTPAPTMPASSGWVKPQTFQTKNAGMDSVDPETGAYRKQGTRWYGKTKQGMLESDAIQAGYQAAK
jgi:hypothetical protein